MANLPPPKPPMNPSVQKPGLTGSNTAKPPVVPGVGNAAGKPTSPTAKTAASPSGVKPQALKPSQFGKMTAPPPPQAIDLKPIEMPDTKITAAYCLEMAARILDELAERQEDQTWVGTHVALAAAWQSMAEGLMAHEVALYGVQGDAQLKQQEMAMNFELHQQTLAQNDQMHTQKIKQNDEQHKVDMRFSQDKQKIDMQLAKDQSVQKIKQNDEQHKFKMQQQKEQAAERAKIAKQKAAQKPKPSSS